MKNSFLFPRLLPVVVFLALLGACKKSSTSPQDFLPGKWIMNTATGIYTVNGDTRKETTTFTASDYFEFSPDGSLSIRETGKTYNGKWQVTNDRLYITGTGYIDYSKGFELKILTRSRLQLYYSESMPQPLEQTLDLSR